MASEPRSDFRGLVADDRLEALYRYWREKRHGRAFPARADIDPQDIPRLLPIVLLIDVLAAPRRYRYRLIGTEITAFAGRDSTGYFIDAARYGEAAARMQEGMNLIVDNGRPYLTLGNVYWLARKEWVGTAVLMMPLAADGVAIDMLLGGMVIQSLRAPPTDPDAVRRVPLE